MEQDLKVKTINCIVLIDDDPISNFITKGVIEKRKASECLRSFSTGKEGLDFISDYIAEHGECPQLIMVDINMPELNGFELVKRIKDLAPCNVHKIFFVGLTSVVRPEWNNQQTGFNEFIAKPIKKEKAEEIIQHCFSLTDSLQG